MTERTSEEVNLVKLSDSDLVLADPEQDVRGLEVYDNNSDQIGSVADLYVDEEHHRVRFLDVRAGGFLGIGEKNFLIPVQAVLEVEEGNLTVDQSRQKVLDSPPFDTSVVPQGSYQRDIYDYYGYTPPRPDASPGAWPGGV
jgi:sporulation protein YlmC with PRC-barrel domain